MKTFLKPLIALSFAVLAASQPAHALTVSSGLVADNGNNVDASYTSGNNVGVDFEFVNGNSGNSASVTFTFTRDPGDAATASFNSIISWLIDPVGMDKVFLSLDSGARFSPTYGSVITLAGAAVSASGNAANDLVSIVLAPATTQIYLGEAAIIPGALLTDWEIDLSAVVGNSFTLTARAVDEPGGLVLMLGALAAAGFTRKRRN